MTDLEKINKLSRMYQKEGEMSKIIDIHCTNVDGNNRTIATNYMGSEQNVSYIFDTTKEDTRKIVTEICGMYIGLTPGLNELLYGEELEYGDEKKESEFFLNETNADGNVISQLCVHNLNLPKIITTSESFISKKPNGICSDINTYNGIYQRNKRNIAILQRANAINYNYNNRLLEIFHLLEESSLIQFVNELTVERIAQLEDLDLTRREEIKLQAALYYASISKELLIRSILEQLNPEDVYQGIGKNIQKRLKRK